MDVVEAIDVWIDEQIDELNDAELERVLEILDAISLSPLAQRTSGDLTDSDVEELAELATETAGDRRTVTAVLRAALFDEAIDFDRVFDDRKPTSVGVGGSLSGRIEDRQPDRPLFPVDPVESHEEDDALFFADGLDDPDVPEGPDDTAERLFSIEDADDDVTLVFETLDERTPADDETLDERTPADDDVTPGDGVQLGGVSGILDTSPDDDEEFLGDLAAARRTDEVAAVTPTLVLPEWTKEPPAVPLAEFDELGPSFLPEPESPASRRRIRPNQVLLPLFLVVGLAVFGFGTLRLIDSLDSEDAASAESSTTPTPEPTAAPTETPTEAPIPTEVPTEAASTQAVDEAPAAPEIPPAPLALRLETGEVLVVDPGANDDPVAEVQAASAYDLGEDDPPARQLVWGAFGIAIADDDGNVLVLDPTGEQDPTLVYDGDGALGEAIEVAALPQAIAVLTDDGDIVLVPASRPDPDTIPVPEVIWSTDETGSAAIAITAVDERVPFALEDGNARMIDTANDNAVITIWLASVLPPVDHVEAAPGAVLLGNGDGAVTRYRLGDIDGERVEPVWEPSGDGQAAVDYRSIGERTVLVLADGSVVLTDGETVDDPLWDPTSTEIHASFAAGNESAITVLLETGSVLRIPLDDESPIVSVWDVTDSTLSPATQVALAWATD